MSDTDQPDETAKPDTKPETKSSDEIKPKNHSRRILLRIITVIAVIAALIIAIPIYIHSIAHESSDDAFIDAHIIVISPRVSGHVSRVFVHDNQRVKSGDLLAELDPKDFKARLDAAKAALEAAKATNKSSTIHAELTSITTTSDINEAHANVDSAKASVQSAQAEADASKSKSEQAVAQIEYARSTLAQTVAELDIATARHQLDETDLNRYRQMASTISKQQLDHAAVAEQTSAAALLAASRKVDAQKAMVIHAKAALKTSEDDLRRDLARVKAGKAQLNQATARLTSAMAAPKRVEQSLSQAQVSAADINKAAADAELGTLELSYTKIYASANGYVTRKYVEPGMYVQTGQALMSIVLPDVWVTANFKETQLTHMHPGQPVDISVDAYPDVEFKGHVDSIQRGTGARFSLLPPENATGNYVKVVQRIPVKIVFDNLKNTEKYVLAPGMSVVPEINIKAKPLSSAKNEPSGKKAVSKIN